MEIGKKELFGHVVKSSTGIMVKVGGRWHKKDKQTGEKELESVWPVLQKLGFTGKKVKRVHWEDPEGSGGEGGGRGDWDGEYMYIHGWLISVYDKNHYN